MKRRDFLKGVGGVIGGVGFLGCKKEKPIPEIQSNPEVGKPTIGQHRGRPILIRWEGCDDFSFGDPHPLDCVETSGCWATIKGKLNYRYLRFVPDTPDYNGMFCVASSLGSHRFLDGAHLLSKNDVMDFGDVGFPA